MAQAPHSQALHVQETHLQSPALQHSSTLCFSPLQQSALLQLQFPVQQAAPCGPLSAFATQQAEVSDAAAAVALSALAGAKAKDVK